LVVVVRSAAASGVGIGLDGVAPLIGVSPSFLETFSLRTLCVRHPGFRPGKSSVLKATIDRVEINHGHARVDKTRHTRSGTVAP